ncbi:MAG: 1,4-dihydroxy-2-naphthoate polyprenyltransferase [Cytophagales bacterium]|nr:1,4-dihydroxy-2-naphthoate polyprenyltransferase [Bernardetiaceae bacterium]MDW8204297.1 1,4-dihydroxy-2-naphthoate polyprenyltransferase [Cytophagales bacterium]
MNTSVKAWIRAFRLRTLPLSLASIFLGSWLAAAQGSFRWQVFFWCVLTTMLLQILSNLANDYGDFVHGADTATGRQGPARAVQSGIISPQAMQRGILICALLTFGAGIALLYTAFSGFQPIFWLFLGLGLASIAAAITYTAGAKPYGYIGLGDLSVLIFFGWVGVIGSYYLHTLAWQTMLLLPATACGLLAVAVLNINNIRDIHSDKAAGKRSIPVRLGTDRAVLYHWLLLGGALGCALVYALLLRKGFYPLLFVGAVPALVRNGLAVSRLRNHPSIDLYLKQMALSALLFVTLLGLGVYLAS